MPIWPSVCTIFVPITYFIVFLQLVDVEVNLRDWRGVRLRLGGGGRVKAKVKEEEGVQGGFGGDEEEEQDRFVYWWD